MGRVGAVLYAGDALHGASSPFAVDEAGGGAVHGPRGAGEARGGVRDQDVLHLVALDCGAGLADLEPEDAWRRAGGVTECWSKRFRKACYRRPRKIFGASEAVKDSARSSVLLQESTTNLVQLSPYYVTG